MNYRCCMGFLGLLVLLVAGSIHNAEAAAKIGKIFIRAAEPDEQGFIDPHLEDTVKDMKKRLGDFVLVDKEDEADFLLIVISREETSEPGFGNAKRITATLSVRDNGAWKPGIKITKNEYFWGVCAHLVMSEANKWVKDRAKKEPGKAV